MKWQNGLVVGLVALMMVVFTGCLEPEEPVPTDPETCTYDGKKYEAGDKFPSTDGCNSCFCDENGNVACTEKACLPTCKYDGKVYTPGDSFPSSDGCNSCSCSENGMVMCTLKACIKGCFYGGTFYEPGESFDAEDGCNKCSCSENGMVMCTKMYCPVIACEYDGKMYKPGSSFPSTDGCNTCTCGENGMVGCTKKMCLCNPKQEWQREYKSTSPEQCKLIKFACPPNTTYFANSCGCGCEQDASCPEWLNCMPPTQTPCSEMQAKCPFSSVAY